MKKNNLYVIMNILNNTFISVIVTDLLNNSHQFTFTSDLNNALFFESISEANKYRFSSYSSIIRIENLENLEKRIIY